MTTFYNTIHESGSDLKASIKKASKQDERVLDFFTSNAGSYTPCEVWERIALNNTPLTSIRRSITNLTIEGHLEKTDVQRKGIFGKVAHTWKVKELKLF